MERLSKTEMKVAHLIAQGYLEKEIADKMFVSEHTTHTHTKNIRKKLGARNIADVTRIYMLQILPAANDILKAMVLVFFISLQVHIIFYNEDMDLRRVKTTRISRVIRGKNKAKKTKI